MKDRYNYKINPMATTTGIYVLLSFLVAFKSAGALMCYQCADTQYDSPCVNDYEGLVNTTKGLSDVYMKNCTDSNRRWDRCVIETHRSARGEYTLYKRGCHDGIYFNKNVDDMEFHNLTANNATTCAHPSLKLICYTFCDTDYCNGPQWVPDPCDDYDPNSNDTLPEGIVCRGTFLHGNIAQHIILPLAILAVVIGRLL